MTTVLPNRVDSSNSKFKVLINPNPNVMSLLPNKQNLIRRGTLSHNVYSVPVEPPNKRRMQVPT